MSLTIPIQEKAISFVTITECTNNLQFVKISYFEYYNYDVNNETYSGSNYVQIVLPYCSINSTLNIEKNAEDTDISWSWILKNNENTILVWDNNLWFIDTGSTFQTAILQEFHDIIINLPV